MARSVFVFNRCPKFNFRGWDLLWWTWKLSCRKRYVTQKQEWDCLLHQDQATSFFWGSSSRNISKHCCVPGLFSRSLKLQINSLRGHVLSHPAVGTLGRRQWAKAAHLWCLAANPLWYIEVMFGWLVSLSIEANIKCWLGELSWLRSSAKSELQLAKHAVFAVFYNFTHIWSRYWFVWKLKLVILNV